MDPSQPLGSHSEESAPASLPQRSGSSASHGKADYFDPEGTRNLQRTLSQMSGPTRTSKEPEIAAANSETTLTTADAPFDLEKTLRDVLKRCSGT